MIILATDEGSPAQACLAFLNPCETCATIENHPGMAEDQSRRHLQLILVSSLADIFLQKLLHDASQTMRVKGTRCDALFPARLTDIHLARPLPWRTTFGATAYPRYRRMSMEVVLEY